DASSRSAARSTPTAPRPAPIWRQAPGTAGSPAGGSASGRLRTDLPDDVREPVAQALELAPEAIEVGAVEPVGRPFEPVDHQIELPGDVGELPNLSRVRHGALITRSTSRGRARGRTSSTCLSRQ